MPLEFSDVEEAWNAIAKLTHEEFERWLKRPLSQQEREWKGLTKTLFHACFGYGLEEPPAGTGQDESLNLIRRLFDEKDWIAIAKLTDEGCRRWSNKPYTPKDLQRKGLTRTFLPPADIGQREALKLRGQLLEEKHYTFLLDETGTVQPPKQKPVCTLLKGRIPKDLLDRARSAIRSAASSQIAAGNRVDAAGAGKGIRLRPDGTETKITGVPTLRVMSAEDYKRLKNARDGTVGYYEDTTRVGQKLPCRQTAWTAKAPISQLSVMAELADVVAKAWRESCMWAEHEVQMEKASKTRRDYVLESKGRVLPFTTITCNNKWRTAAHVDSGDLKEGFGVLCCLGDFEGCDLVFPRYKLAVRYREGDILLADVANQVHGNTPLLNPDGAVPKLGEEPERLVCVFYYREQMELCASPEEEMAIVNNWKTGQSSRENKKRKTKS